MSAKLWRARRTPRDPAAEPLAVQFGPIDESDTERLTKIPIYLHVLIRSPSIGAEASAANTCVALPDIFSA